jgi:hypothetical protein
MADQQMRDDLVCTGLPGCLAAGGHPQTLIQGRSLGLSVFRNNKGVRIDLQLRKLK